MRTDREPLPDCLDPLVTPHPAAAAYRVERGVECQVWTYDEQIEIARALVTLDRGRQYFRMADGGGTFEWAAHAGRC